MKKIDELVLKYVLLIAALVLGIVHFAGIQSYVGHLLSVLSPIFVAMVLAYLLNLLVVRFEKLLANHIPNGMVRAMSIVLSLVSVLLVGTVMIGIVVPQLASALLKLTEVIPSAMSRIQTTINENQALFPQVTKLANQLNINFGEIANNAVRVVNGVVSSLLGSLINGVTGMASNVINSVLSFMLSIYIVATKESLISSFGRLFRWVLPRNVYQKMVHVLEVANESFANFITGMLTEAVILGTILTVSMTLLRFPYASMIGVMASMFALIPVLGAYLSAAVGFLMILAVSPTQAVWFLVFILIVQQIEGNLIYPRVVGDSIGLPGIWVLSSVTVFGGIFGIPGMLVGVPVAATIYQLLREAVTKYEQAQSEHVMHEE